MNVPKLRFKEFDGEWSSSKLGEIAEVKDSARISNEYWLENGIPYLRSSDLVNDDLKGELFISKETYDKYASKTGAPEKDDMLFTSGGKIGVVYHKEDNSLVYVQGGAVLYVKTSKSKILEGAFLSIYFSTYKMKKYIENVSAGGTIKHFTLKPANTAPISFPTNDEQIKIGKFFKKLDKKIQLQQQKIDLLQEQKKGYMQKIFNQEIRFKDENEEYYSEWEEYTLNDLGETYTGLSGKTKEDFGFGEHSFVTYVNVFNNLFAKSSGVEKVIIEENEKQNYVKTGDIFLTTSSETPREVGMASIWKHDSTNLHLNSFCFGYRITNSTMLPDFLAISLRSEYMRNKITILAQGSTRYNISKTALMKEQVYVPSIREQKKIVEFHHKLSSVIELEMQKLTALKQQKQGFMQQMFI